MGFHANIDAVKWPKQGSHAEKRVEVMFHFGGERLMGTVVRDDGEAPHVTIIKLDDGRHVLATECQYRPVDGYTKAPAACSECGHPKNSGSCQRQHP